MIETVKQAITKLRQMEQTRTLSSRTLYELDSWIRGVIFDENSDILNQSERIVAQDFYIATLPTKGDIAA